MKMNLNFNWEDVSQIIVGAFALSVPISFSEEALKAGANLPASIGAIIVDSIDKE
jgi:uncharacterized membrane protein